MIKKIINSDDKKGLLSNFLSLSALQAMNMFLPLLVLPYLVKTLGIDKFGLINFAVSIIAYFNILVSFGFELSATRRVSMNRGNIDKISEIFSTVMLIKISLLILSLFILYMLILFNDTISKYSLLYYATFGIVIGNVIFPDWFFQGMEKMKYITYINVISRVSFTILIFLIVKTPEDYIYVPILNTLGSTIGGLYALWLVFKLFNLQIVRPTFKMIWDEFKESALFFLSRVANNGSRSLATTIIGIYFGNTVVGYYSMVEKLYYASMSLGGIVAQTIYPYMSRTKNISMYKKIFLLVIISSIITTIPIMYYNQELLSLVFHVKNEMASNIFLIMFSGSVFGVASALLGYPLLAALGYVKYANYSLIYASLIYIFYIFMVSYFYKNIYLLSLSTVIYAVAGLSFRLYYIKKTNILKQGSVDEN